MRVAFGYEPVTASGGAGLSLAARGVVVGGCLGAGALAQEGGELFLRSMTV